jgi:antimicrobial peptide system SdpA family protein
VLTKDRPWGALAFLSTLVILVSLFVYSVVVALPKTVLTTQVDVGEKTRVGQVFPQGWSFFTRDPQSTALVLLSDEPDDAVRVDGLPQTLPRNAFGLTRNQRSQDTEKAAYANDALEWVECGGMLADACLGLARDAAAERVAAVPGDPNFCGKFLLAAQKPVPFLFREHTEQDVLVERVAHVDVDCEGRPS